MGELTLRISEGQTLQAKETLIQMIAGWSAPGVFVDHKQSWRGEQRKRDEGRRRGLRGWWGPGPTGPKRSCVVWVSDMEPPEGTEQESDVKWVLF